MPITHVVQEGEHLGQIAAKYGFLRMDTLWDAPENADLKKKRENPNVLLAGDQVVIPDKQARSVNAPTEMKHKFVARPQMLHLRVRVLDSHDEPLKSADCELTIDGKTSKLTTDGDGYVETDVPMDASEGTLRAGDVEYELDIGGLDPVDTDSGLRARLNNLGYWAGDPDDPDEHSLAFAIELFQADYGLTIDATKRDEVIQKLEDEHGC